MSGWDFYGNTIVNSTTGVLLGGDHPTLTSDPNASLYRLGAPVLGGRDNKIHDNYFLNNDKAHRLDARTH